MPIKFKCPSCDQMLAIARRKAGSVISCPRCSYPATVPENEGETARPAAVGRPQAARPAFERGDFDRWIGGRREQGSSGATMLAEPPLPTLSETHTGLLDTHRERRERDSNAPVIDVRLAVALILGIGLMAFGGGFFMGRNASFAKPSHVPATNPAADANKGTVAQGETASAAAAPKFVLNGTIEYRTGNGNVPDAGARILAFPTTQKPLKKISTGGLRPGDEKAMDQTGVDGLMKLGGAVATADAKGVYSVTLPKEGAYWILVLSKNVARPGPLTLQLDERKLYDYFADANSVLGEKDFALAVRRVNPDEHGTAILLPYSPVFRPASQ